MLKILVAFVASLFGVTSAFAEGFSDLHLRSFISLGFGVVLNAPDSWRETSGSQFFQVVDPVTNAQFTSSGYEAGEDLTLQHFASWRFSVVDQKMPYLKQVKVAYTLHGKAWEGIAAEYQGAFPGNPFESYYLVLCILKNKTAISFTITSPLDAFEKNEALYRWLLSNQLDVLKVVPVNG